MAKRKAIPAMAKRKPYNLRPRRRPIVTQWSDLPVELVQVIAGKISNIADYIRFRSVCSKCRSSAKPRALPPQIPRLLLPYDPKSGALSFAGLLDGKTTTFSFPELRNKIICGSSFGWLALADSNNFSLSLWNPFTRALIALPPVYRRPKATSLQEMDNATYLQEMAAHIDGYFIFSSENVKISLSTSPSEGSSCLVALAIADPFSSHGFALCRVGSDHWHFFFTEFPWPVEFFTLHKPMVCICAKDLEGLYDDILRTDWPEVGHGVKKYYWLKMDADLLMVLCYKLNHKRKRQTVRVFKLEARKVGEEEEEMLQWAEVRTVGDHAIFLSHNHAYALRAHDFPGCRADCIYFSDVRIHDDENYQPGVHYVGVFGMKRIKYEQVTCNWTDNEKGLQEANWFSPCFV